MFDGVYANANIYIQNVLLKNKINMGSAQKKWESFASRCHTFSINFSCSYYRLALYLIDKIGSIKFNTVIFLMAKGL